MEKKHVIIMIILVTFLIQGAIYSGPSLLTSTLEPTRSIWTEPRVEPAGAGGESPLVTNVIRGSGYEQTDSFGAPANWATYGSCYTWQNASYTSLTYAGGYSGRIVAKATPQWGGQSYLAYQTYTPPTPKLTQGVSLDFYTYIVSNPDLAQGSYYFAQIEVSCASSTRYIYYLLSYRSLTVFSNNSYSTYIGLNATLGSWQHLQRNVTADYELRFGAAQSSFFVSCVYWTFYSARPGTGPCESVIDEASLFNRTAYEFLQNGDFEDGDGSKWSSSGLNWPGYVYTTAVCTEGSQAANMTVRNQGPNGYGYAYLAQWFSYPQGLYAAQPGTGVLEFDWKYSDTHNGGSSQVAYFTMYLENTTFYCNVNIYLGRDMDYFPYTNTTNYICLRANGFGNRTAWQHQVTDLGALLEEKGISNIDIENLMFWTLTSTTANSSVTLLIDRFGFRTYPTIDPGFEQDWAWSPSNPVPSWLSIGTGYPYVNLTPSAHSGKRAANITAYAGTYAGLYRNEYVSIEPQIYTDFWYQVKSSTSVGFSYAYVALYLNSGFGVYYILAGSSGYSVTNGSNSVYYFVDGFNQTGTWKNMVRNVTADVEAAFGPALWYLDQFQMICYGDVGGEVSVIFDDMNFVADTHAPSFTFVGLTGPAPMYYNQATARIELTDLSPVTTAVYYNNGSGWVRTLAANKGSYFLANISQGPYGTMVHWYVNATDSLGHIAIDDNHGNYYTYMIGDNVPPVIDSIAPINNTVVKDWSYVNVSAHDPGVGSSGVSHVELWFGSTLLANDSSAPYQLHWNTQLLTNGTHTFTVRVVDSAGNVVSMSLRCDIENAQTTTASTTTVNHGPVGINPLLIGAGGAAVVIIVLAIVFTRRRTK
jgi:hypothetical protein